MLQAVTLDAVPGTPEHHGDDALELVAEEKDFKLQLSRNRAMRHETKMGEGYQNVAVLLIKWADEIDQLQTADEVEQVRGIFADEFNFPTKVIDLNNITRPQLQLERNFVEFMAEYDGDQTLMIIYYTGHGSYDERTKELNLHA
jgi:hypothetical protein